MAEVLTAIGPFGVVLIICATYYTVKHFTFSLPTYRLRAENIAKHGWPPPGMDADGDWHGEKPAEEEDADDS